MSINHKFYVSQTSWDVNMYHIQDHVYILRNSWWVESSTWNCQSPVSLLWSDAAASQLAIGSAAFTWKLSCHDDVIKYKHFPHHWPFVREIHRWQRPVTRSFDVFFDLRLNKRLSKQWWDRWFETPWPPLCRHCNVTVSDRDSNTGPRRVLCKLS